MILEDGKVMINGVVYSDALLKHKENNLYNKSNKFLEEHLEETINEEYIKKTSNWKPKIHNPEDIRISEVIKKINKQDKCKDSKKTREKIIELKKTAIWLLKNK